MNKKYWQILLAIAALVIASLACGLGGGDEVDEGGEGDTSPAATNTPVPSPTPEPAIDLGDEFRSEEGGFAFLQIPGWVTEELFGFASHSPPDADEDTGPAIIIIGAPQETDYSLDQAFAEFSSEMTGDVTLSEPTDLTIAGAPARSVDLTGTDDAANAMAGRMVIVLVNSRHVVVIFGFGPQADWDREVSDLFDAVVDSFTFFEPTAVAGTGDGGDIGTGEEIRQWAAVASASSQYADEGWSAGQATGEPNVYPECGDSVFAWASTDYDTVEWLELTYNTPVVPTEVNIYETYNPGQIISVEVRDLNGDLHQVYSSSPTPMDTCSSILTVFPEIDFPVNGVLIYIDQSVVNDWAEIDAVELVGFEGDGSTAVPPPPPPVTAEIPDGFRWRSGGESGISDDQYSALGGMDVDSSGFLYVSDNIHGVWIFDSEGNLVDNYDLSEFNNPNDVAVSEQGGGYIIVSAWGANSVFVLDFNGNLLTQFGGEGNGPGEFGSFSPESVTVDLNNNIYVLDETETDSGDDLTRVQVFDINGNYQYEWVIEDDFFAAASIEFWAGPTPADDRIYVLGFVGGYIIEYDLDGNRIGTIGEDALDFSGPQHLDVDAEGNFYVTTWTPDGVMKLDHDGNLVEQWGYSVEDGEVAWGEGGFYQPNGVAVSPDGAYVYANDWSGDFSFITAFEFP